MSQWVVFAILSAVFAGATSVIAKLGLVGISSDLGLAVRTCFVWLGLSGVTTAASWVFDYKALKLGEVSTIALIDKGSFLVAVLLAWLILKEEPTQRTFAGAALILAGLVVVARKEWLACFCLSRFSLRFSFALPNPSNQEGPAIPNSHTKCSTRARVSLGFSLHSCFPRPALVQGDWGPVRSSLRCMGGMTARAIPFLPRRTRI